MKKICILFILFISLFHSVYAQKQSGFITPENTLLLQAYQDTINFIGDSLIGCKDYKIREAAAVQTVKYLVKALKTPNSFKYTFDSSYQFSIIYAPDNSFRIFTWQLTLKDLTYRYYGTIQMNSTELKLFPLIDMSMFIANAEDTVLDKNNWFGGIYYNIIQMKYKKQTQYILFGWDGNDMFSNKKMLEVLTFSKSGEPIFGKPVFKFDENSKPKSRIIFEYKEDASPYCNWDSDLKMIVFDHLTPEDERSEGIGMTYIPDGSYESFKFVKGIWELQRIVFDKTMNQAPDYTPKHKGENPDIYIKRKN